MRYKFLKYSHLAIALFVYVFVQGQGFQGNKDLPVDSNVVIGKLANGFTYYIRQNHKPEKRVEMRLVVNAGSILENQSQRGLAHLTEHMCFNGTKHFAKNDLVQYLQSIGMRFGADLNAYTSFDKTVYMLTIPSDSADLIDNGFLVLEDWAHNVSFDSVEVEKERGVVHEEWRLGRGPWQRMRDKYLPVLLKDSRYAERLPIGLENVILHAPQDTLREFYHDWYRPDLMALIVVGDIDPALAEEKIKEHFSWMKGPAHERKRVTYPVPDEKGTLVSVTTDKEAPVTAVRVFYKSDVKTFKTYDDYLRMLKYTCLTGMLNRRLYELTEKANPPFIGANFQYGNLVRTKDALQGYALVSQNGIDRGLETLLKENARISKYGFTKSELERYKKDLLNRYETSYDERNKTNSREFADEYIRNFLDKEPIPGIKFEYNFVKNNLDRITVDQINDLAKKLITDNNRVIIVNAPQNDSVKVPTQDEIMAIANKVKTLNIKPYVDSLAGTKLMAKTPAPGKIISEKEIKGLGAVDITLSNGARVILKPTDFKNDQILLSAFSKGGTSVYPDSDYFTAENTDGIVQESGVSKFSNTDLNKILAGKSVYVAPTISDESEGISASTKPSDLKSMFQLIYLYFTNPRFTESSFNSYVTKKKDLYQNLAKDPQYYFYDKYHHILAQNSPRGNYLPTPEDWKELNFNRAQEIYKDRFADANNFTFIIVGSFKTDSIKSFLEKYIASLPTKKRTDNYVDVGIRPPKGNKKVNVFKGNDPKSLAILHFETEAPWNERDAYMLGVLGDVLGYKYIEILREKMSGVYTFRVSSSMSKIPYSRVDLQITIPCGPANVDSLVYTAIAEIKKIQTSGVEDKEITKAKETRLRQFQTDSKTNNFWLNAIQRSLMNGSGLDSVTHQQYIDQISSAELQRVAKKYINTDKYLEVVLYPENYEDKVK